MPSNSLLEATPGTFEVRDAGGQRGLGVFALTAMPAGTVLFKEYPLVAMQHLNNRAAGVRVCERCFRFLGPIEDQIRSLLIGADRSCSALPTTLPPLPASAAMPLPVPCPGGCTLRFCSAECASINFAKHHRLLCHGCSKGSSSTSLASPATEIHEMIDDMQISPPTDALKSAPFLSLHLHSSVSRFSPYI